jgi:hypothetical protein
VDQAKLKKLLLVALSSDHPGEAHAALTKVKKLLASAGHDIHWLVEQIDKAPAPVPPPFQPHPSPYGYGPVMVPWQEMLIFVSDHRYRLRPREEEFIGSLLNHSIRSSWRPTMKQHEWLSDIYESLRKFSQ